MYSAKIAGKVLSPSLLELQEWQSDSQPIKITLEPMRPSLLTCQTALCLSLAVVLPAEVKAQGLMAAEVWASWQEATQAAGGSLTAETRREGTRLVIENIELRPTSAPYPAFRLESLSLMGQADGSVRLESPPQLPLQVELPSAESDSRIVTFTIATESPIIALFGLGQKAEIAAQMPKITVSLASIEPMPQGLDLPKMELVLEGLGLRYKHDLAAAAPSFDGALLLENLSLLFEGGNKENGFSNKWSVQDIKLSGLGKFPASALTLLQGHSLRDRLAGVNPRDLPLPALLAALNDGLNLDLSGTIGATDIAMTLVQDSALAKIGLTLEKASAGLKLNQAELAAQSEAQNFSASLLSPQTGEGTEAQTLTGEAFAAKLTSSLADLSEPQNWAISLLTQNLHFSDGLWAQLLPKAEISREPITLTLEADGTYALAPEVIAQPSLLPPTEMPSAAEHPLTALSFNLKTLEAKGLGTTLKGSGALEFDLTDLGFIGQPIPNGTLSFGFTGVAGLIDRLSKAGILSPEQAIQARLGLPMIAKAGEENDSFTSDLDFRDKSFYLNGKKIR